MQGMKPETLTKRRVTGADDPLFVKSLDIYRTSFPLHEQRRVQDFPLAFEDPGFYYEVFLDEAGRVAAILVTWRRQEFVYLEYFAVSASLRGQDEISRRRLGFYRRHGFVPNPQFDYIHPPYTAEGESYPLLLMTHEKTLDPDVYQAFVHFHHEWVVRRFYDISSRPE